MIPKSLCFLLLVGASYSGVLKAQNPVVWDLPATGDKTLVHEGWYARNIQELGDDGCALTSVPFRSAGWIPATVPGTVLTTLLDQGFYPAPEVGLNNERIPDIARVGRDFYTYWFACPFVLDERWADGQRVWLNFRGINYKAELFLNGKRINRDTHEGMFLRQSYEVTSYLLPDTVNLLAVLVYPPDHVGNPNGGQGGDGQIARNCTMQYTPGWDWIQPVRDRNTGIWDEVSLTVTGDVLVNDPYVVTKVPGVRDPQQEQQEPAYIHASVEVENLTASERRTTVTATTGSGTFRKQVVLQPFEKRVVAFDPIRVKFAISDKEYLKAATFGSKKAMFADETIQIKLADGSIYPQQGIFRYTDNQVDKDTNSVTIFADFANADKKLLANSYVDVIISKQMKDVFLVRQKNVILNDKGAFVYVMQKGKLKLVPLKIAGYSGDSYITENRFAKDEFLVVDKIGRISPETKLKMKIALSF